MSVRVEDYPQTSVNIAAKECVVKGSSFIEKMRINDRLRIKVKTCLSEGKDAKSGDQTLDASTDLQVWCEVVPPFTMLPLAFLEKTCVAVLRSTLKTLLNKFVQELAVDYHSWSTDDNYRQERAQRSLQ